MSTTEHTDHGSYPGDDAATSRADARGASKHSARLRAMIAETRRAIERVMDTPVTGPRGQQMSLREAQEHDQAIQNKIAMDEARGSLRHRIVSRGAKILTVMFLGVIDFPIMLWLASSVFNVDWSDPVGLPLAISLVISLLGTAGAAWVLYHLGHNRRENKNDRRQLDWADLSPGAKISLIGAGLLVTLISVVMFVRVYTEGVLSGLDGLALLLAVLIAFIMLLSAALVFSTAFRDGSPEQDDLAHYSDLVQAGLRRKRDLEDRADQLQGELDMLLGPVGPDRGMPDQRMIDPAGPTRTMTTTNTENEAGTNGIAHITAVENDAQSDNNRTRRAIG